MDILSLTTQPRKTQAEMSSCHAGPEADKGPTGL